MEEEGRSRKIHRLHGRIFVIRRSVRLNLIYSESMFAPSAPIEEAESIPIDDLLTVRAKYVY